MVRKSQVKAIAARAKQPPAAIKQAPLMCTPAAATTALSRTAKKAIVNRAKPLTKANPSPLMAEGMPTCLFSIREDGSQLSRYHQCGDHSALPEDRYIMTLGTKPSHFA